MRWLLGLSVFACLACQEPATAPHGTYVAGAVPITDTTTMRDLWQDMQACSHLTGTLKVTDIHWYSVPTDTFTVDGVISSGVFVPAWREIYIARWLEDWPQYDAKETKIAHHEIMHALLWPTPSDTHPSNWFGPQGPCGDLMSSDTYLNQDVHNVP